MAVYWHPFLAQFLRWGYGSVLEVRDEVPLGEMPPRLDLLLIRRQPEVALPIPFCHLGITTLVQYNGPEDVADQDAVDHAREHRACVQVLPALHTERFSEVLAMRQMTAEEIGVEKEKLMRQFGPEAMIEAIGLDAFIRAIGPKEFIRAIGPERVRELLQEMERTPQSAPGAGGAAPS